MTLAQTIYANMINKETHHVSENKAKHLAERALVLAKIFNDIDDVDTKRFLSRFGLNTGEPEGPESREGN